ncbi:hypothetical protein RTH46_08890 [Pseudomonas sp. zfem004]|uniref:hypothetical protein n=1 Tax=Pseudomonas sp. zfem004 TaxID=3078199 RepID=UPI002928B44A|nr:hypothetical protein [Pseudomonas sp. zfem004]MDU9402606.1 hypothetical protein [Pseudomonas sp. zfem004]
MPARLQIFKWGLGYYAPIVCPTAISIAVMLLLMVAMPITSMLTTVVLATAVISTAVVPAQEIFEKAHGARPSSTGDINTSKR